MKHSLPLLSLFGFLAVPVLPAQAQTAPAPATHRPALFRLGLGGQVREEYGVSKLQAEYAPQFGQHLRLGSRLAFISGSKPYYFGEYSNDESYSINRFYRSLNVEQEVYWLPFGVNKAVEFSVGLGAVGGYSTSKAFVGSGVYTKEEITGKPDYTIVHPKDPITGLPELVYACRTRDERGFHVGYIASLNADVALDPAHTWRVGGRLSFQNDTKFNYLYGAQFQLSHAW